MSERYEAIRVPVEADRAATLRAQVRAEVTDPARYKPPVVSAAVLLTPDHEPKEIPMSDRNDARGSRRVLTIAAASVLAVGLAATALVLATRPDDDPAVGQPAPSTTTTTTTSTTTTTLRPLTDSEIASRVLPEAAEWGPSVQTIDWQLVLDGSIAATVPECTPFLAAFESADRPAQKAAQVFAQEDPSALGGVTIHAAYVVVFPDEGAARDMFDATADPDFMRRCRPAYEAARLARDGDLDYSNPRLPVSPYVSIEAVGYEPEGEVLIDRPPVDVGADEQWTIELSRPSIPEAGNIVTVRVGRVVAVTLDGESRNVDPVDDDTYTSNIAGMVDRARQSQ